MAIVIETLGPRGSETPLEIFNNIGLSIYQPVAGCSEVINQHIIAQNGLLDYAQSCLRSDIPEYTLRSVLEVFQKKHIGWS